MLEMKYDVETVEYLRETAKRVRRGMIESIGIGVAGHVGGGCSSADILTVLYFHKMKFDPGNPYDPDRDRFLLSKGHAAVVQYSALALAGVFPKDELLNTKSIGSMLQGHPDVRKTPGIEAGTGSLGQGLSIGLGMALGLKLDKSDRKVYVVIGDGEMAEGQIWEAAMAACVYKADNLVAILDKNRLQATGFCNDHFDIGDVRAKWDAFGWHVLEVDGHDIAALLEVFDEADRVTGKPVMIIAHTIKGKGVSFAENVASFHNGVLTEGNYAKAIEELS